MSDADEPQISLALLEIFGAMMRCETTVEAAEQLGISQPAVSNGLRQLERQLGITLFERIHRRLEPTAEAVALYDEVRPLFGIMRGFSTRARDIRQGKSGRIRIVSTPPLGHTVAPRTLEVFLRDRPEVSVSYDVRRLDEVVEAVKEGSADLGVALALEHHLDVNVEVLHRTHMVAMVRRDSDLAGRSEISARDLAGRRTVGLEAASRIGQMVRSAFARDLATYDPRVEVRYTSTAAVLAGAGLGVAVVDPYTAEFHARPDLVTLPFNPPCEITVVLLLRKGVPRSRLVHSFIEELRRQFRIPAGPTARPSTTAAAAGSSERSP